jgi:precorrin isomerase
MPRGGKREGAGRKPGLDSDAKRALMDLAKGHAPSALQTLVQIMENGKAPAAARITAAVAVLDRAYGKPAQMIQGAGEDGEFQMALTITRQIVDP